MIMRISNFENDIVINSEYVRVLEVEDKKLFINIVQNINSLCYNQDISDYIILLDGDKELDFAKNSYFVFDILNINFNERKTLNKLYSNIKTNLYLDDEIRQKLESYYISMLNIIDSTLLDFPFEFEINMELIVEDLLRFYKIKLVNEGQTFMDKILNLIDLISSLGLYKLLIFCNIKTYFTDSQLKEIYKHIIHNKLHVLLIEGSSTDLIIENERKNRIDVYFDDYEI